MVQVIGLATFKDDFGTWYGNICVTPNGTKVTNRGLGYCRINKSNVVANKRLFYVGQENGKEIWKREVKDKNGEWYFRTEYKQISK